MPYPARALITLRSIMQGSVLFSRMKQEVLLYWRQEKSSSTVSIMSLHSSLPPIVWELSGDPCETQEKALSGIKNDTEAFIICSRGDEFLQATCNGPENYHCEISFVNGKNRELYMAPKALDYSQLHDLFSRYAAGEDLSRLNREWTLDVNKTRYIPTIIVVLAIIAVLATIIFQSMN